MKITYIGHATLLLEIGGVHAPHRPELRSEARPIPAARVGAGIALEQLPELDAMLLTHAHADHLSFDSLDRLPRDIPLYAPPAVARWLRRLGLRARDAARRRASRSRSGDVTHPRGERRRTGQPLRLRPLAQRREHVSARRRTTRACFFAGDTALSRRHAPSGRAHAVERRTASSTSRCSRSAMRRGGSRASAGGTSRTTMRSTLFETTAGARAGAVSLGHVPPRDVDRARRDQPASRDADDPSPARDRVRILEPGESLVAAADAAARERRRPAQRDATVLGDGRHDRRARDRPGPRRAGDRAAESGPTRMTIAARAAATAWPARRARATLRARASTRRRTVLDESIVVARTTRPRRSRARTPSRSRHTAAACVPATVARGADRAPARGRRSRASSRAARC